MEQRTLFGATLAVAVVSGMFGGVLGMSFLQEDNTVIQNDYSYIFEKGNRNSSEYSSIYSNLMDSVVFIKVFSGNGVSQGTGFVYDGKGRLVTNEHVVDSAGTVEVRFKGGEWRQAEIVGEDEYTDIAVLEVERMPSEIMPLKVAETNPVPGQKVVALGSPFGLQGTITHGIVSGVNRSMETSSGFLIPDAVQTDAPIDPGNSGGPLVNMKGEVVGLNTAKQGDNIGFAVSPTLITRIVPSLVEKGVYRHPYLGVNTFDVSPVVAALNEMGYSRGVIVVTTADNGPAGRVLEESDMVYKTYAGEVPVGGDVIVSIDGKRINSAEMMSSYLIRNKKPGDRIRMTVIREGEERKLELQLGARPL